MITFFNKIYREFVGQNSSTGKDNQVAFVEEENNRRYASYTHPAMRLPPESVFFSSFNVIDSYLQNLIDNLHLTLKSFKLGKTREHKF